VSRGAERSLPTRERAYAWRNYLPTREVNLNEADAFASGLISDEV
jgi:hypothetical protein